MSFKTYLKKHTLRCKSLNVSPVHLSHALKKCGALKSQEPPQARCLEDRFFWGASKVRVGLKNGLAHRVAARLSFAHGGINFLTFLLQKLPKGEAKSTPWLSR